MHLEHGRFFVPFSKVDRENRIVWGIAQTEEPDTQDDLLTYDASVDAFSKWAGNIREMHDDTKSVGRAVKIVCDPDRKQIHVGSFISKGAEDTWQKVLDGTLRGYSIGGGVIEASREMSKDRRRSIRRVTKYALDELSLVDTPANSSCVITAVTKRADNTLVATDVLGPVLKTASDVLSLGGKMQTKKRAKMKELVPLAKGLGAEDSVIVAKASDFTRTPDGNFVLAKGAGVVQLKKGDLENDGYMDEADESGTEEPAAVDLDGHATNLANAHADLVKLGGLGDPVEHYQNAIGDDEEEPEAGEGTGVGEPGVGKSRRTRGRNAVTKRNRPIDIEGILGKQAETLSKAFDTKIDALRTELGAPAARRESGEGAVIAKGANEGGAEPNQLDKLEADLKKAYDTRGEFLRKGAPANDTERRERERLAKEIANLEGQVNFLRRSATR